MAVKYRLEVKDISDGVDVKVDISEASFAGSVTNLVGGPDPVKISWENESDDVFSPIKYSKLVLTIITNVDFVLADLYSVDDFRFPVIAYANNAVIWTGFVSTGNYSEPYADTPFPITITCDCGMTQLKNILYDNNGTYYNNRRLDSQIVLDILGKIGITSFSEYCNIYETGMDSTEDDSPFDQTKPDVDIFRDKYCDEVLSETLKKYNAIICQTNIVTGTFTVEGFCIYRPTELVNATVYGRKFTGATTKTSRYIYPEQFINRAGSASTLFQVPGGALMIERPAKKVTINQDYGYKESWIDNWQFKPETFDSGEFEFWTQTGTKSVYPISLYVPGEKDGVLLKMDTNDVTTMFYQKFGYNLDNSAVDFFVIEYEYGFFNTSASQVNLHVLTLSLTNGPNNLNGDDPTTAVWENPATTDIGIVENAPVGWSGWKTYRRQFIGIPNADILRMDLLPLGTGVGVVYDCIRNIKFYTTSTKTLEKQAKKKFFQRFSGGYNGEWQIAKKYYTVTYREETGNIVQHTYNPICIPTSGNDLDYDYILGDVLSESTPANTGDVNIENIIEQFAGSLTSPQIRIDKIELTGGSGSCIISVGGLGNIATWNAGGLSDTASDFVTANSVAYAAIDITLTSSGAELIFTHTVKGLDFYNIGLSDYLPGGSSGLNATGDLVGIVNYYVLAIKYSTAWNTRGGSENKPLLEIIGDEIALQYSRPKQLIQMPIIEDGTDVSALVLIGNFQDSLNTIGKSSVNLITDPDGGGSDFNTTAVSGTSITSLINSSAGGKRCLSNNISIIAGNAYTLNVNVTLNSGTLPGVYLSNDGGNIWESNPEDLIDGTIFIATITDNNARLTIDSGSDCNLSATNITLTSLGIIRKFTFNRGSWSLKFRRWMIDLVEIIS